MSSTQVKIGFIGLGVMGKSMARNLMKAGFLVEVFTRTKSKAEDLLDEGCHWCESISEIANTSDVVITMLGFPSEVKDVYFDEQGLLRNCKKGTILIDMSTSSPTLAKEIAKAAKELDMTALDAPVSGGDIGAREARLTIMVGGEEKAYTEALSIFEAMGTNVVLQGEAGMGQYTKMVNQIAIASNMIGVSEAISYAKKAGLDPCRVLHSIENGAAGSWSLSNLAPRMIVQDYSPGFYIKHFVKDMTIALESAKELGLKTPGLELAKKMYEELIERGSEDEGTQALIKLYQERV
ncbi:NAD(P)-dependent oxidoreductase [Alkalihalophilus lindianensis]|uniref:NAD(P)-dependent oxidoreductase n=1 Tax=Alkalihalophilus lindianensis TaxID=1630542 RepID=A0ABU3XB13_9BACI|nr:NAD(P)-dependent oxidoreductase [Alkalihalophilus lindianensis]MDV2684614.1 NAD(P)-dependent oxidoreductase [Alkalihalophilus lindianensis]